MRKPCCNHDIEMVMYVSNGITSHDEEKMDSASLNRGTKLPVVT